MPERIVTLVAQLREAGVSTRSIAERIGVSHAQILQLVNVERAKRTTIAALGLLSVADFTTVVGTQRRIQALCMAGFPLSVIARESGVRGSIVKSLAGGSNSDQRVFGKIKAVYDQLWNLPPSSVGVSPDVVKTVRNWASEQHWFPCLAWDDDTIDDPESTLDLEPETDDMDWPQRDRDAPIIS